MVFIVIVWLISLGQKMQTAVKESEAQKIFQKKDDILQEGKEIIEKGKIIQDPSIGEENSKNYGIVPQKIGEDNESATNSNEDLIMKSN